jgi:hypothetical protein
MPPPVSFLDVARTENEISIMFRLVILLTKGVLRDTRLRRNLMLWLMLVAMVMLFLGSWLMSDDWARKHFWLYFLYWAVCGWITLAGVLLAIFDMLIIRATARALRIRLEREIAQIDAKTKGEQK